MRDIAYNPNIVICLSRVKEVRSSSVNRSIICVFIFCYVLSYALLISPSGALLPPPPWLLDPFHFGALYHAKLKFLRLTLRRMDDASASNLDCYIKLFKNF